MALDATNRQRTFAQLMRAVGFPGSMTKAEIKAAVDAVDDWADANATSYNNALPQPFRGAANAAQKNMVLAYVCMRRAGILKAQED